MRIPAMDPVATASGLFFFLSNILRISMFAGTEK